MPYDIPDERSFHDIVQPKVILKFRQQSQYQFLGCGVREAELGRLPAVGQKYGSPAGGKGRYGQTDLE